MQLLISKISVKYNAKWTFKLRHCTPWFTIFSSFFHLIISSFCIQYTDCMLCIKTTTDVKRGTRWCSWLRYCATCRKAAVSIPDGVTGIFLWHNPSGHTVALGSTQPLTEMSTRYVELTTLPPSSANCLEFWAPQPPWILRTCPGMWWDCFTFTFYSCQESEGQFNNGDAHVVTWMFVIMVNYEKILTIIMW